MRTQSDSRNATARRTLACLAAGIALLLLAAPVEACVEGLTGTAFHFTAKADYVYMPDGEQILMWGLAPEGGRMQYPAPTLRLQQGDTVTIDLDNELGTPVSLVFPGFTATATGGVPGYLAREAPAGGSVRYTLRVDRPGTFTYHSGTRPELQIEMGIVGALVVYPTGHWDQAYAHPDTRFDDEFLFLLTEIDPRIHKAVEENRLHEYDFSDYHPVYWCLNGRAAPDTMAGAGENAPWLPTQPYNCMPVMHPGDILLLREVGGGRDFHPFHNHGNHSLLIGRDGFLLESAPGQGPDLAELGYSHTVVPGGTMDALFTWTGEKLGFDIYGHQPGDPLEPGEYEPDHAKPLPVFLPDNKDMTFGMWWNGSPHLGSRGPLPPNQGMLNPTGGFYYMWHSHSEKELTNNDIFPGGCMTMLAVEHPSVLLMCE